MTRKGTEPTPEDRGNIASMQSPWLDLGKLGGLAWTGGETMANWNNCPELESVPGRVGGNRVFKGPGCRCMPCSKTW